VSSADLFGETAGARPAGFLAAYSLDTLAVGTG
jgi:hypothetical protein